MDQEGEYVQADPTDSLRVTAVTDVSRWYIRQICPYALPFHLCLLPAFAEVSPGVCNSRPLPVCPVWRPVSAGVCGSLFIPPCFASHIAGRYNVAEIRLLAGQVPNAQRGGQYQTKINLLFPVSSFSILVFLSPPLLLCVPGRFLLAKSLSHLGFLSLRLPASIFDLVSRGCRDFGCSRVADHVP